MKILNIQSNNNFSINKEKKINPMILHSNGKTRLVKSQSIHSFTPLNYRFNYLGRDLVSFGNRPFYETLKDNYFQLIQGNSPDNFQIEAGKLLNDNKNVIVEAPTGTGKTAIAHYVISKNLNENKKTFYTTPLKALSNQKFKEFKAIYGDENVGILTGDRHENEKAPILIMTTEVYRNMMLDNIYKPNDNILNNLGSVIFDEFHYLGDYSRGSVWEEALMYTPENIQTLSLSATIGNSHDITDWMNFLNHNTSLVKAGNEERTVPLEFDFLSTKSYKKSQDIIQKQLRKSGTVNYDNISEISSKPYLSDYKNAVNQLSQKEQLPAIFFIFSRKFSRELLDYLDKEGKSLTSSDEKIQIKSILENYKKKKYIGEDLNENALLNGYAIHNAGIIPAQKELIEELFQKKLIKTVLATETLSAGINMPAKTVVISSPYKPSDDNDLSSDKMRMLTSNEFKQMAGRAGRRGIDKIGFVYSMPVDRLSEMNFLELEAMDCNSIESQYNPEYAFLCSFFEFNNNFQNLKNVFEKSFYAYNKNPQMHNDNVQKLLYDSNIKADILKDNGFIIEDNDNYFLTNKGFMASKINSFNPIIIVNLMESKKLDDLRPETLAMVIGAIADSDNDMKIDNPDVSLFSANSENLIENIKNNLKSSIESKLKILGKSFNSFNDYSDLLNFAENISTPNMRIELLENHLNELQNINQKLEIILDNSDNDFDIYKALQEGKTIPNKVLFEYLKIVENYKKHMGTKDINSYIQKLNGEMKELQKKQKGKKSQIEKEKKIQELQKNINDAKIMQLIDLKIYDEINSNQTFLKKNPQYKVKKELKTLQRQYIKATSKDELINEIKSLIKIEQYIKTNDIQRIDEENLNKGMECINEAIKNSIKVSEKEKNSGISSKNTNANKNFAKTAYNWALLNKINPSSLKNWNELIKNNKDLEEGIIYRSILQTIDLLGQMIEASNEGMKYSTSNEDYEYYKNLKKSLKEARRLMINPPIEL